tara:strand:+ start:569 stop:1489 length:921 start_codon:yes stop_codon:yes gene_type:complete
MKIFVPKINESWIVDRAREEWHKNNKDISTKLRNKSDVIWIMAPWLLKSKHLDLFEKRKVLCTYHHIDLDDFKIDEFKEIDKYVNEYHVISNKTEQTLRTLTDKKITAIPLWVNENNWFYITEKENLRKKFNLKSTDFLIGSFQRDTEGRDLKSPKLIKGPDIFVQIVKEMSLNNANLKVLLTGKRRQYVINELERHGIPYAYFKMANIKDLNELYNILDLYVVSSRLEGGPQAISECAITKTPIISTNVGLAPEILSKESIYSFEPLNFSEAKPNIEVAYKNVKKLKISNLMISYRNMFEKLYEN